VKGNSDGVVTRLQWAQRALTGEQPVVPSSRQKLLGHFNMFHP
jgi:hypothetical protein